MNSGDGARSELILTRPIDDPLHSLYWLPAMGVPARHYLPWAQALAAHDIAVALHEWRGIGSSDRRAGRHLDWGYHQLLEMDIRAGVTEARAHWPQATSWMGGHSLGGQLACLYASLHPCDVAGMALVASGAPYWRCFSYRPVMFAAYALATPLARLLGHFPGRAIGFGGNEARSVIADWARSGRTGRYSVAGLGADVEPKLAALRQPVLALRLRDDWMVPPSSLAWLLGKMPKAPQRIDTVGPEQLSGQAADHFSWMKQPNALAAPLANWMRS
ncbi:alpha/beta fold hydrolase [Dyella jejuensis]